MPEIPPSLVGKWKKLEGPACAASYPPMLQIEASGLYSGRNPGTHNFMLWDDGTVRLHEPDKLAVSTANDAILIYDFAIDGDVVTFTSADGCVFRYRRMG
jgi:hypothetical protein